MYTLLIAEDNDDLRFLLKALLRTAFKVLEAKNGEEAIDIYKKHKPDMVLMDIRMPKMNGIEATKHILCIDKSAKIIGLTAYSELEDEMLKSGVLDLLKKPVRKAELIKNLNLHLQ